MATALEEFLNRHIEAGTIPGAVALLGRGDDVEVVAAGVASLGGRPMRVDDIFRIQSMTKVVTTVAALRLVEAGRIGLDSSVEEWLPELADRQVLVDPAGELLQTVPAVRPITLRHLLTNTSGYGAVTVESPLLDAMIASGVEGGFAPVSMGADDWLARLAELPLAFQPGEGWRYHHSFSVLGILLARLTGRPLGDHLHDDLFAPLGMVDTAFWVPEDKLGRLPAAYRHEGDGFVEVEAANGGFYAGPPPFEIDHGELVSTAADFAHLTRMLTDGGRVGDVELISPEHLSMLTTDQVPDSAKAPDSFFPGFWDEMGWGFGVGVQTTGPHAGRYGWSGGLGTDFFVDPDGTVGILLTQVEMGDQVWPMLEEFQELPERSRISG